MKKEEQKIKNEEQERQAKLFEHVLTNQQQQQNQFITKCNAAAEPGDAGAYEKTLRQITGTNMMSSFTFCFSLFSIS